MNPADKVSLHALERSHLEETLKWSNDPEVMRLMDRAGTVSPEEHEQWFSRLADQPDRRYFAILINSEQHHIGNVWLWNIDQRHQKTELRIVIGDARHRCQGQGTEAIALACDYAFGQLNLHRVYSYVLSPNKLALRAFEKAGFVLEGTLRKDRVLDGHYTDVFLLGKLR